MTDAKKKQISLVWGVIIILLQWLKTQKFWQKNMGRIGKLL